MNKKLPLSPNDIQVNLVEVFPEFVIEAVNNLIIKYYKGRRSFTFKQKELTDEILRLSPETYNGERVTSNLIYDNHWLDIEELYIKNGWKVTYEPGYNESYDAFFKFEPAIQNS